MIRGFWQSRLAAGLTAAAAVCLAAAIWVRDRGYPVYIPIVASGLMLAIGAVAARLIGNIVANTQNTKYLGILHIELDPETFIKEYAPVPGRLRPGSRDWAVASAYLADGCAAAGQFRQALETLHPCETCAKNERAALDGLYHGNRAAYCLGAGDAAGARSALAELDAVIGRCREGNPALARNLTETRDILKNRLAALTGGTVDAVWMAGELERSPFKLRRLEILQALAQDALNRGDAQGAADRLRRLEREGGKTCYAAWASQQIASSGQLAF